MLALGEIMSTISRRKLALLGHLQRRDHYSFRLREKNWPKKISGSWRKWLDNIMGLTGLGYPRLKEAAISYRSLSYKVYRQTTVRRWHRMMNNDFMNSLVCNLHEIGVQFFSRCFPKPTRYWLDPNLQPLKLEAEVWTMNHWDSMVWCSLAHEMYLERSRSKLRV